MVARAITREGMGKAPGEVRLVHLDMRHIQGIDLHRRFPGISKFLNEHWLDLGRDLIPIRPAAHYLMGGIKTDLDGHTSLPGLYAAGEAACTGVHGANRLASNSLLEGLVFGARAAQSMLCGWLAVGDCRCASSRSRASHPRRRTDGRKADRRPASSHVGLCRPAPPGVHAARGFAAQKICAAALAELAGRGKGGRRLAEAQALSTVAHAILHSALPRTESRGAHFRNDYPKRDDKHFLKHSRFKRDEPVTFEEW